MGCSRRQGSATLLHVRVGVLRLGLTLVTSLMLALVIATPAMAGTASVAGGTLTYAAAQGEANTLTVTQTGPDSFEVTDTTAAVTAGAGCTASLSGATCNGPITAILADLFDLNDVADVNASVASELLGRTGIDQLTGGDGPDTINGGVGADTIDTVGPGRDTVLCDADDTVSADPDDSISGGCLPGPPTITSGPSGPTNETSPTFSFAPTTQNGTGFECMIDPIDDGPFGCDTPFHETTELPDGPYLFRVRAINALGAGPWVDREFAVDTHAPQVTVTGPPSGASPQLTFQLTALDPSTPVSFECAIDQADLAPCTSPYTTPSLAIGTYVLFVKGTDAAGNSTTTEVPFGVTASAGGGGGGGAAPPAPVKPSKIIIESLVLISGKPVKMARNGRVSIRLQCAGTSTCKGRMSITTAEPVKRKSRKLERLGSTRFTIAANKSKNVKVRFSKAKRKLAKRLKRFKAKVVINEVDKRGNKRISSRVFVLRAR